MTDVEEHWLVGGGKIITNRETREDVTHRCTCPRQVSLGPKGGHRIFEEDIMCVDRDCPIHGD